MMRPIAAGLLVAFALGRVVLAADKPPAVGEKALDFELKSLAGETVQLAKLIEEGPVVVVALRGYPGYQCPLCSKQFGSFLDKAEEFAKSKAQVVFIYPGPADKLKERADEFIKGRDFPDYFHLLLDPDYKFTTSYGIHWDEPKETAYPSTFVINGEQKVTFAKVSKTHGGRSKVEDVLKVLSGK